MRKGKGTPGKPIPSEEVEQGPCLAGVGARQAVGGDAGDADQAMANPGFIHLCPGLRLTHQSLFW